MAHRIFEKLYSITYLRTFTLIDCLSHQFWLYKKEWDFVRLNSVVQEDIEIEGFVINLESRRDRLNEVTKTLLKSNIKSWQRVEAIQDSNGALGCAMSHQLALNLALSSKSELQIIFEDDVVLAPQFTKEILYQALLEFYCAEDAAVLCLAFKSISPGKKYSKSLFLDDQIETAAAYVVKKHHIPRLIRVFARSEMMLRLGIVGRISAIDMRWKLTQKRINFVRPESPLFIQKPGWSNIEKRSVDYTTD